MHCDWVGVTVPDSDSSQVRSSLVDLASTVGAFGVTPELYRFPAGGTMKFREHSRGFVSIGISGSSLAALQLDGLLPTALHIIGSVPHRVTRLDVALDRVSHAPPILSKLLRKARAGDLQLTRKYLSPKNIRFHDAYNHHTPGARTGSLYLGTRAAEVRAIIYDKQNERLDKGFSDPGPLTRYELTVTGKLGPTLRDVIEPGPMYWRFMRYVLPPPANSPDWEGGADGFSLPEPVSFLPAELLRRKVETSPDIDRLLQIADEIGPHGFELLVSMLRRRSDLVTSKPDDLASGT